MRRLIISMFVIITVVSAAAQSDKCKRNIVSYTDEFTGVLEYFSTNGDPDAKVVYWPESNHLELVLKAHGASMRDGGEVDLLFEDGTLWQKVVTVDRLVTTDPIEPGWIYWASIEITDNELLFLVEHPLEKWRINGFVEKLRVAKVQLKALECMQVLVSNYRSGN